MLKDSFGDGGDDDEARERHQHSHGAEGKVLLARLLVVEGVVNGGRHSDVRLSSCRHKWRCWK